MSYHVDSIRRDRLSPYWYCWRFPICVVDDYGNLIPVRQDMSLYEQC